MAILLTGTTIGGHSAVHAGNLATHGIVTTSNIGSYALTSLPANAITTTGGQTIGGITYFSGVESINLYGIRGRFTNEYIHLYNKVGIGHPGGWGQGEGNTPAYGLSTYGGANFAYGNNADSTFNGIVYSTASFRAPIFYDSNNTSYYLDPNSSTSGYFAGTLRQNDGKYVRDSSYRTISGYSDYYSGGDAGWYRVAEITLTGNCSGSVLYGTLYDHRYDGADAYQISIVARAECSFTSDNEQHYINVGCTILGSTAFSSYQSKIRVLLVASSTNSRTYELQFYETNWNHDTWQLETTGWTVYSSPQAPRSSTGTARVNYISNQNADYQRANSATYSPIYYDSQDTNYYLDPNSNSYLSTLRVADASSGVSLSVGNGSTHGVYTADNARKYLVVAADYYPHMAIVASGSNNQNHGAVFSFVGTEGSSFRQWNLGTSNQNPFLFSIGYNATGDANPHYGVGDAWSSNDAHHARLSIDRDGNTKIRGMLYVNGTSGGISTGNAVIHAGNIGSQSVSYATTAGALTSMNISQFTNNSGYLTSLPSHNHDDRYFTETESDSRYLRSDIYNSNYGGLQVFRNIGSINGSWTDADHTFSLENSDAGNIVINFHRGGYTSHNLRYNGSQFRFDSALESTGVITATGGNSTNWNTAYSWGNHASAGYLTSSSLSGYATQTYVNNAVSALVDSAPGTLDTLNELAAALGDDPNFATTVSNNIATKLPLAGGTLTGDLRFNQGSGYGRIAFTDNYHGMVLRGYPNNATGSITVGDVTSLIQHSGDFRFYRTNGSINELYFQVNSTAAYHRGNQIWDTSDFTSTNVSNWNTAYGWGNHASAGYQSASTAITTSNIGSQSVSYATTAGTANAVAWTNVSSRPTALSQFTNDLGNYGSWITASHLNDYTNGAYRVIADYGGHSTWYIRSNGQFIWGSAHDWTASFRLSLTGYGSNGDWAYFGQQDSNTTQGTWRGVRIRKYDGGAVDGDLSAGAFYIGDTRKDTNWDTAYSWGNHAGLYAAVSHTHTPSQVGLGNVSNAAQVTTTYNSSLNSDSRNSRGVTRLYRRDSDSDYSVQTYWTGSYWRLYGYNGDSNHADTHVGYADSAGSVAWTNVSSRPTNLSQFTNDLGNYGGWLTTSGKAADSELIDGIDSSRIVYGSGSSKVSSHSNANDWRDSGFYENDGGGSNWPTQTWYNSINVRHSNQSNYHGFQIAMSYYDNNLWFRSYQGSGTFQSWAYVISSQNIGSQSVNYATSAGSASSATNADTVDSLHASSFIRSDASDDFSGNLTSGSGNWIKFTHSSQSDSNDGKIGSGVFGTGLNIVGTQTSAGTGRIIRLWGTVMTDTGNQFIHQGNIGSQSVASATNATTATNANLVNRYSVVTGSTDWNTVGVANKLAIYSAGGFTSGANNAPPNYNYGSLLSWRVTGEDMFQIYFPENSANSDGRKMYYRSGWNGTFSSWNRVLDMTGNVATIQGSNQTGLQIYSNVSYNQDPLTFLHMRGQADNNWESLYIQLTGDAGGQNIEFRRFAQDGRNDRMWYISRIGSVVTFEYTVVTPSDSRLKDNQTNISTPIDKIKQLNGVEFDWNAGNYKGQHDVGVIAQEVEEVLPEAVSTDEDGYKAVAYDKLVPLLIEGMKEQQALIESLKARIDALEAK